MSDDLALWQRTLAAEHSTIWAYGLVGATPPLAAPADAAIGEHRDRRSRCSDEVVALGGDPVASAPAYDVTAPPNEAGARRLAARLEESCTLAYVALAAANDRSTRLLAAQWLRGSSISIWGWDGELPTLPGLE
ncbi:MAG: ferritin-like domain-containing protein [Actinomycetia bacterium]|nr:ferritin-like domain-containing protein [Actinomycetes bacterium]